MKLSRKTLSVGISICAVLITILTAINLIQYGTALKKERIDPFAQNREDYKKLLTECIKTKQEDSKNCAVYQTGIFNGLITGYITAGQKLPFCLTHNIENSEFDKELLKTVSDPQVKTQLIPNIILETLVKNYPCPSSQKK